MDKLNFKIFYKDDGYHLPHVAIKINGKDLAKMIIKESKKNSSCRYSYLAGRDVSYFLGDILTSKNPRILTDAMEWQEEYPLDGIVGVNIQESNNSIIWEIVGLFDLHFFSFEFEKEQYYQKIAHLINIWGCVVPEETLNNIPKKILCRIEKPLRLFSSEGENFWYFSGKRAFYFCFRFFKEETTLSKINNEWVDEKWLTEKFIPRRKHDCKQMRF